jgi:3-phenylpropionate/cinnamic acid dioxygenase small subunit
LKAARNPLTPVPTRPSSGRRGARPTTALCFALAAIVAASASAEPGGEPTRRSDPFSDFPAALDQPRADLRDRLEILNLIGFYSHLADGFHTERFGRFFTESAVFSIVPHAAPPAAAPQLIATGRAAIVDSLRARHAAFRRDGIQRRHFLTNPIVWDQTDDSARVGVYLQLVTSRKGGPARVVGTGRYEGRAVKTLEGWQMAEWTIFSDQVLE